MSQHDIYENPLIARYASPTMARLLSPQARFSTWRKLWVALAEAQQALGLPITDEQIAALRDQVDTIDFDRADAYEKRFRHDVMAHIHALGDAAPAARPIIHLGRHELLRHRQRRFDPDARRPWSSSARRRSPRSTRWRHSPRSGRTFPAWATPTFSRPNW